MGFDLSNIYDKAKLRELLAADIDAYAKSFDDGHRRHLGASEIGHACDRYLWFKFRWMFYKSFEPRMLLLFQRGHREEAWLWEILRSRGWTVIERDPATNEQLRVSAVNGHFGGSLDAVAFPPAWYPIQEWILIECKTKKDGDNSRVWDRLTKFGVTVEEPKHWTQACTYGYLKGIRYCIYISSNKDNDHRHIEPLILDPAVGARAVQRAEFVILNNQAPPKLHQNLSMGECKYCDARDLCHKGAAPLKNCRSCQNSVAIQDKQWFCQGYNAVIPSSVIETGCAYWRTRVY